MSTATIVLIVLFAFMSTFIQRVTGFGFGITFMTISPFLMPTYGEATALCGALALVCSIVTGVKLFRYVPWKKLLPILLTFLVVSFFSVSAVAKMDGHLLKHILGVILILVSIYFFILNGKIRMNPTVPMQMGMGTIAGVMGGLFAMQGPPAVIYFISCTEDKREYMALTQWYFIVSNIAMTCFRAGNGFFTPTVGKGWLTGVGAVLLGLFVGSRVYDRMPVGLIRKFVYVFIAISGLIALIS